MRGWVLPPTGGRSVFFPISFVAILAPRYQSILAENQRRWWITVMALVVATFGFAMIEW